MCICGQPALGCYTLTLVHLSYYSSSTYATFSRARGVALRQLWASFHSLQTTVQRLTPSGFRGPCHLPPKFTHIVLDMVHTMVSPIAGKNLQGNREDLVSTGGSIMLAAFISHAIGPFASKALQVRESNWHVLLICERFVKQYESRCQTTLIYPYPNPNFLVFTLRTNEFLSYIALQVCVMACKVAAAMQPMLESGIVAACLRYMNYLESLGKLQWLLEGTDGLQNRRDMSKAAYAATQVPKLQWFDCILIITRIATHVAGIFR